MAKIALKVDVDTYRGTKEGVLPLCDLFEKHGFRGTFLFSLGPDHTGRAIKRVFNPEFRKKVGRTSVVEHYGVITLLRGTLLPGPQIGKKLKHILQEVHKRGHEVGIHTFDHFTWQDYVTLNDEAWARNEMNKAKQRFEEVFGFTPKTHGAAGWQMNHGAYLQEQDWKLDYASDTRGTHPFWPVSNGVKINCVQIPSTLPTLDEILGVDNTTVDNVHELILKITNKNVDQVYTLHSELEGMKLMPVLERLVTGWKKQGHELGSCLDQLKSLNLATLPHHEVTMNGFPGRAGLLAQQGKEVTNF